MSWIRRPIVLAALVGLVAAAVFTPALTGGWIYDDHLLIPENPYVHSFQWWPRWFLSDFWDIGEEFARLGWRIAYWRPTITATYALDWQIGGGTPLIFHVTNLVWHAIVAGLAFVVLRRWIDSTWPAVVAAVLFAIHPTKAESVAWIAGRTDVICAAAVLLASEGIARRLRGARWGLLLELAGTLLAYTSKEQAIVLPAFAAVEAWVAMGRPAIERGAVVHMLRAAAPQLVIAAGYLALRAALLPLKAAAAQQVTFPLIDRAQMVLETLGRFITLTFAPHDLSIQHGLVRAVNGELQHSVVYVLIGAASLIALLALAVWLRRRSPAVTIGIAFFAFALAPTLNIVNTQMETLVSERFLYLPLLGLSFAVGVAVASRPKRWVLLLAGGVVLILAIHAANRASDYRDEDAFWARELVLHPESAEARRGKVRAAIRSKRYYAALVDTLELTRRATKNQDVPVASDTALLLADLTPDYDRAGLEAIDAFCRDLIARKAPAAVLQLRGLTLQIATKTPVYERDMRAFELRLLALRSSIHSRLGYDTQAVAIATEAFEKCPRCTTPAVALAMALARAGRYDDALVLLEEMRRHSSTSPLDAIRKMIVASQDEHVRANQSTGPAQLQTRAAALAKLELWGRAYDVLSPYKDQIKTAPRFALGFAELAFRAGDTPVAREMLAAHVAPTELEQQLERWGRTMGWVD